MRPGPKRTQVIDRFWTSVYSGFHVGDLDALQARSFDLNDYLHALDELNELNAPTHHQVHQIHRRGGTPGVIGSAGVVREQDQVAPSPTVLGQCSHSVGRGST
jgi:hypothetical protein